MRENGRCVLIPDSESLERDSWGELVALLLLSYPGWQSLRLLMMRMSWLQEF
jgi:hypothetical protein